MLEIWVARSALPVPRARPAVGSLSMMAKPLNGGLSPASLCRFSRLGKPVRPLVRKEAGLSVSRGGVVVGRLQRM
jgi:hypothetical protein